MRAHKESAISTALHPPKVCDRFLDGICSILNEQLRQILCLPRRKCNVELAFLDTLLKLNNRKISTLEYRTPAHRDQQLHYSCHHQTSCKESVVSFFNRAYSIIPNKDDLTKEYARKKEVLKENGYQENLISKIFKSY